MFFSTNDIAFSSSRFPVDLSFLFFSINPIIDKTIQVLKNVSVLLNCEKHNVGLLLTKPLRGCPMHGGQCATRSSISQSKWIGRSGLDF